MQNWKKVGPVIVWDTVERKAHSFASLDALIRTGWFGHISDRIGDQSMLDKFARNDWGARIPFIFPKRYLVRDENGLVVPIWKIDECMRHIGRSKYTHGYMFYGRSGGPLRDYKYRCDPVPYVHCYRGGNSYFRNVGTFRERRENDFCNDYDEDAKFYGVRARAARTTGNLPEPWDDIGRSDWGHRSWKRHRKTQWKTR